MIKKSFLFFKSKLPPLIFLVGVCLLFLCCQQNLSSKSKKERSEKLLFKDCGTKNWTENWFLDGKYATIINSDKGMEFNAGSNFENESHHAVIWTKKSFEGKFRLSFEYIKQIPLLEV